MGRRTLPAPRGSFLADFEFLLSGLQVLLSLIDITQESHLLTDHYGQLLGIDQGPLKQPGLVLLCGYFGPLDLALSPVVSPFLALGHSSHALLCVHLDS